MSDNPTTIRLRGIADGVENVVFSADTITSLEVSPRFLGTKAKEIFPNSYDKIESIDVIGVVDVLQDKSFIDIDSYITVFPELRHIVLSKVKEIGDGCFYYCPNLETVDLGTVETIGEQAFYGLSLIQSIEIPSSLRQIKSAAFEATSLSQVIVSDVARWSSIDFQVDSYYYGTQSIETNPAYVSGSIGIMDGDTYMPYTEITEYMLSGVNSISPYSFYGNTFLTSVDFPPSITTIGRNAFTDCTSLQSITFQEGLKEIGAEAFYGCSRLSGLSLPSSLEIIGENAFPSSMFSFDENGLAIHGGFLLGIENSANRTSITIPNGVVGIMEGVGYNHTYIESVEIPESISSIPYKCFSGCTSLSSVNINGDITTIGESAFSNCTSLTSFDVAYTVTLLGDSAFEGCSALSNLTFYGEGQVSRLHTIGNKAFLGCTSLTDVELPDSVTSLGSEAFSGCSGLERFVGRNVERIESKTFSDCTSLTNLTYCSRLSYIGDYAFYWSGIKTLTLPNSVREIGDHTFESCSELSTVLLNTGLTTIGTGAFRGCGKITTIVIPDTVTNLGASVFSSNTKLTSVSIGDGVRELLSTFYGCTSLSSISFGKGLKFVDSGAFSGCDNISTIRIKDFVSWTQCDFQSAGANPISKTHKFVVGDVEGYPSTTLTIPSSVRHIGSFAFAGWNDAEHGCKRVVFEGGNVTVGADAFNGCTGINSVSCPSPENWMNISFSTEESNPNYYAKNLLIGGNELLEVTIPNGTSKISPYAFYNCINLASVSFSGGGNLTIGADAFYGCNSLSIVSATSLEDWLSISFITIGSNPNSIASNLFIANEVPTDIVISDSIHKISQYAFCNCTTLNTVSIQYQDIEMGEGAFLNCTGLRSIDYPSLEKWMKLEFKDETYNPVYYSHHLKIGGKTLYNLEIPNTITKINKYAFINCHDLKTVTIPSHIQDIPEKAFQYCASIETLNLEEGIKEIKERAFDSCTGVRGTVTIPNSVQIIRERAFSGLSNMYPDLIIGRNVNLIGKLGLSTYKPGASRYPHPYNSITFKGNCPATIGNEIFGPNIGYGSWDAFSIHVPENSTGWGRITNTYTKVSVIYDQPPIT